MNELIDQYCSRARKIAHTYEIGELNFADLTGLSEEFAASFYEQINELPEAARASNCSALEAKLVDAIDHTNKNSTAAQALDELLISINRTPIY